jgi:hypothetical protein
VVQYAAGVDGGANVAADLDGRVYLVWHGPGEKPGEAHRRVYVAASDDDGQTFPSEAAASSETLGACACCGIEAQVDAEGTLWILYRAATDGTQRDTWLLTSTDGADTFAAQRLERWQVSTCPMSTGALASTNDRVLFAWETRQKVSFATMGTDQSQYRGPYRAAGPQNNQKHPALAVDAQGRVLLAWAEDTGWARGGAVAWQLYDVNGDPFGERGRAEGLPTWSRPAAWADPDGSFVICY